MLTRVEGQLLALFVEAIFYGIYLVSFGTCILKILRLRPGHMSAGRIHWPFVVATIILFIPSTLDISLGVVRVLDPRFFHSNPATARLKRDWVNAAKVRVRTCILLPSAHQWTQPLLLFVQMLIADCVLVGSYYLR
jgi:hypothetical protein